VILENKDDFEEYSKYFDEGDIKHILIDYDLEYSEPEFRWEYQFESITETESLFRMVMPFD
jgi:hypothetical protein